MTSICDVPILGRVSYRLQRPWGRIGEGFPEHPNPSLMEMALAKNGSSVPRSKVRSRKSKCGPSNDEGDFDLIEE